MSTNITKLSDIDTFQGMSLEPIQASRFQRFINVLLTTLIPEKIAKNLSNAKPLNDEKAKDYIDLICRQIRNTHDFSQAFDLATKAKGLVRMMPNYQTYLHVLGEALIDQVTEHQAKQMVYQENVSSKSQTTLHNAISLIAELTCYVSGTPEIIRSKIGQRLEKTWTAKKLIKDLKLECKKKLEEHLRDHPEEAEPYLRLAKLSNSKLSFVQQIQLDFQKGELYKDRNKLFDDYREQLAALGFQNVYDDIIPDAFRDRMKETQVKEAQKEHDDWVKQRGWFSKMHTSIQALADLGQRKEQTMLFAHNNPDSITLEEQDEIQYESFEIKESFIERIKALFSRSNTAPTIKMEDLTVSIIDASETISLEKLEQGPNMRFKTEVLPELAQALNLGSSEHDGFIVPESSEMGAQFNPTLLQRISTTIKEFFSSKPNLPVFEISDDKNDIATAPSSDDEQGASDSSRKPSQKYTEFIKNAQLLGKTSPYTNDPEDVSDDEQDSVDSDVSPPTQREIEDAMHLINNSEAFKYNTMQETVQAVRDNKAKARLPVTATAQI
ncbi:MAG: hypothetical protein H7A40_02985 [Chlamydiales bacterium]|nr:hypothetical protein [Chlamydiales bacterium]